MRVLFVCSTEYQILNALNIRMHLFPDCKADIILQRAEYGPIGDRLEELGIFENICCAKPYLIDLHEYKLELREKGRCDTSLPVAGLNSMINIWRKAFGFFGGPKYHLNNLLNGYEKIRDNHYDKVLMQSGNAIVRNIYADLHNDTEMAVLDEGIGSYCDSTICHGATKADSVYLYDPEVAVYASDESIKFVKIPKLSPDDTKFVEMANKVFNYVPERKKIEKELLFFDQGGEMMPEYLKNANEFMKIILANSIKKHMETYESYVKQVNSFRDIAGERKVYIKYHPRTPEGMINEFDRNIFHSIEPRKLPWELYAINNSIDSCAMITIFSSSVCLFPMIVGGNNICVLLYRYVDFKISEPYKQLMDNLASKYDKNIIIVNDSDDLKMLRENYK